MLSNAATRAASVVRLQRPGEPLASFGHALVVRPEHRDELGDHRLGWRGIAGVEYVAERTAEQRPETLPASGIYPGRRAALKERARFGSSAQLDLYPGEVVHGRERVRMLGAENALVCFERASLERFGLAEFALSLKQAG